MAKQEKLLAEGELSERFRTRLADYLMADHRLPSIGRELAYAVADIRQKVVEEGMYGRPVTPPIEIGIHGETASSDERDPLGRADIGKAFRERCADTVASRDPIIDQRPGPEPER